MQENCEYSVFSLQTVGFYCILVELFRKNRDIRSKIPNNYKCQLHFAGINPKNREILAKCWQMQSNFPKTREIRGKMFKILDKWLHYLWIFPNIRGYSNQFATFLWGFFRLIREIFIKIHHSLALNCTKLQISCVLLAFTFNANANNVYKCIQKCYIIFFSI